MVIEVTDNQDGSGINVMVSGADPAGLVTAQYRDTAKSQFVDGPSRIGDGLLVIPISPASLSTVRSYVIRVSQVIGANPATYSSEHLATPTEYPSFALSLILNLKHKVIGLNLPRIGGNVFHCIHPDGAVRAYPDMPAAFVFQTDNESKNAAISDNERTALIYPIEVGIADSNTHDYVALLPWWLHVREKVFVSLDRKPIFPDPSGRRWRTRFGPVRPDFPDLYQFIYQSVIFEADAEINIGG